MGFEGFFVFIWFLFVIPDAWNKEKCLVSDGKQLCWIEKQCC